MPISDLLAQISGEPYVATAAPAAPTFVPRAQEKRKADSELPRANEKVMKRDTWNTGSSRPIAPVKRPQPLDKSAIRSKSGTPSATPTPTFAKPATTPSNSTPTETGTVKAPKKGSFAEIMARAAVGQAKIGQLGKVSHKPIVGSTRKEREEKKAMKAMNGQQPRAKIGQAASSRAPPNKNGGVQSGLKKTKLPPGTQEPEKKIKKAATATTGYTGTARPNPALMKNSSRPSTSSRPGQTSNNDYRSNRARRNTHASEEEDDEDEEDEEGYDSEGSSDMEAAMYEVDEEEERAAALARREDAEALREENRLKREKEEKKRRLAAMANARR